MGNSDILIIVTLQEEARDWIEYWVEEDPALEWDKIKKLPDDILYPLFTDFTPPTDKWKAVDELLRLVKSDPDILRELDEDNTCPFTAYQTGLYWVLDPELEEALHVDIVYVKSQELENLLDGHYMFGLCGMLLAYVTYDHITMTEKQHNFPIANQFTHVCEAVGITAPPLTPPEPTNGSEPGEETEL